MRVISKVVMAGLVPAIHGFLAKDVDPRDKPGDDGALDGLGVHDLTPARTAARG